jgi:hypothetical protein
MIPIAMPG